MQAVSNVFKSLFETFRKQKLILKVIIVIVGLISLCCLCTIPIALLNPDTETATSESENVVTVAQTKVGNQTDEQPAVAAVSNTAEVTNTPEPTNTPKPSSTPKPTKTPLPPTETPDPNLLLPGTYLVGTDIRPGFYLGVSAGTDIWSSCYWARKKDLSGEMGGLIANDNSEGQYYIEVLESDYALEAGCVLYYLEQLPNPVSEFPQKITPGMYLVGIDIQPGTYKGQAGTDIMESCYWQRLRNVKGEFDGIIANDNAEGQFYIQVGSGDFALETACDLERVSD